MTGRKPRMNRFLIATLSGLLLTIAMPRISAQQAQELKGGATLKIKVNGARNAKGTIRAALFQSAKGFPGDAAQAIRTQAANIDPQTLSAQITFADLPGGTYAVSVFHDENMNQKLDKNFMGIPKEGYGASSNPGKRIGPPSFEDAKFTIDGAERSLEINLLY
jgi:uncharacterized protein (DUF2141 family)